ncbi:MAG: HAD family hydrolase [Schleiferiaceae bacterium]
MNQYKAYIFDFDGVIKESVRVKSDAFMKLYEDEGVEFQRRIELFHLRNGGVSRYEKFKVWNRWLGRDDSNESIDELSKKFSNLVVENVVSSPYIKGAIDAIKKIKNSSLLSFVATGTPDNEIISIMSRLKLSSSFKEIHGSSRNKSEIIEDVIERYHLETDKILFIGDAQTDYYAAINLGLDFYLRLTDYNKDWFEGKPNITFSKNDLVFLHKNIL